MSVVHVVVGGQFGSEAKGHVTGWLAKSPHVGAVVRVAGPNAGHTAHDAQGRPWALRQVPCAAVTNLDAKLYIAAGSEIDPLVLVDEIGRLEHAGIPVHHRLFVDPEATVIEEQHLIDETDLVGHIGSTGKGIGAARSARIMREASTWFGWIQTSPPILERFHPNTAPCAPSLLYTLNQGQDVIIEGTQGFGLGLHASYYPFCTSSDCRAIDFLAMAGINPWASLSADGLPPELRIWPVFRTYPIRVAGNSGELYRELDWAELAERTGGYIKPERTTVTRKIRRIGEWDAMLARRAMIANGWPSITLYPVLTFVDYWFPELADVENRETLDQHPELWGKIQQIEEDLGNGPGYPHRLAAFTTGPDTLVPLV